MRTAADVPRKTNRPVRSVTDAEASAVIRISVRSNAIRPSLERPWVMVPSLTTGCICGVVAHATYVENAPNDDGGGNPCTSNWMSYCCSPAAVTATPNGDGG